MNNIKIPKATQDFIDALSLEASRIRVQRPEQSHTADLLDKAAHFISVQTACLVTVGESMQAFLRHDFEQALGEAEQSFLPLMEMFAAMGIKLDDSGS